VSIYHSFFDKNKRAESRVHLVVAAGSCCLGLWLHWHWVRPVKVWNIPIKLVYCFRLYDRFAHCSVLWYCWVVGRKSVQSIWRPPIICKSSHLYSRPNPE